MIKLGVVDSYLVIKHALEDGVGLGSMLLTTDVSIVQEIDYVATPLSAYKKELF